MPKLEQEQILLIWDTGDDAMHTDAMHGTMVAWTEPGTHFNTTHWACSCGDSSETARAAIEGAISGRFSSPSASFEYMDEQTFVRGAD
jgi:hypothetical protein